MEKEACILYSLDCDLKKVSTGPKLQKWKKPMLQKIMFDWLANLSLGKDLRSCLVLEISFES